MMQSHLIIKCSDFARLYFGLFPLHFEIATNDVIPFAVEHFDCDKKGNLASSQVYC